MNGQGMPATERRDRSEPARLGWASIRQVCLFAAMAAAIGVANALPMAWAQGISSYPGRTRLLIGAICGLILAPVVVVIGLRGSRLIVVMLLSLTPVLLPLAGTSDGTLGSLDDLFFFVQLPCLYGLYGLMMLILLEASRRHPPFYPFACPNCGYDRRGKMDGLCSACGVADSPKPPEATAVARSTVLSWHISWCINAFGVSVTLQTLFVQFLRSLG